MPFQLALLLSVASAEGKTAAFFPAPRYGTDRCAPRVLLEAAAFSRSKGDGEYLASDNASGSGLSRLPALRSSVGHSSGCRVAEQPLKQSAGAADSSPANERILHSQRPSAA